MVGTDSCLAVFTIKNHNNHPQRRNIQHLAFYNHYSGAAFFYRIQKLKKKTYYKFNPAGNSQFEIAKYVHVNELELMNVRNARFPQIWQIGNLKTVFDDGQAVELGKYRDSVAITDNLSVIR